MENLTTFIPTGLRVLIRPFEGERKTAGGIIIPDTVETDLLKGEVVSVGDGEYQNGVFVKPSIEPGTVIFYAGGGREITIKNEMYLLITERELLGKEGVVTKPDDPHWTEEEKEAINNPGEA